MRIVLETTVLIYLLLCVVSLMYPYGFPLTTFLGLAALFLYITSYKTCTIPKRLLMVYLLIAIFFLYPCLISLPQKDDVLEVELKNLIFFIICAPTLAMFCKDPLQFDSFSKKLYTLIFITGSVILLYSFFSYTSTSIAAMTKFTLALINDYNMFSLGGLLAIFCGYALLKRDIPLWIKLLIIFIIMLDIMALTLAGSRRYLVFMLFMMAFIPIHELFISQRITKKYFIYILVFLLTCLAVITYFTDTINSHASLLYRYETLMYFNEAYSERAIRLEEASRYINNFNMLQILFGSGMSYMDYFAQQNNLPGADYPHNMLVSVFIYSGIFGLIVCLFVLFSSLCKYLKLIYKYKYSSIEPFYFMLFAVFISIFLSFNSFFSSKLLTIIILFPWFIEKWYVNKVSYE